MNRIAVYPLTFNPIFKDYPWGGRNLALKLGREIPDGVVAESWDIAAHPNGKSTIRSGPLAGRTLEEVQVAWGESLVGSRNRYALDLAKFPLLIKLLDANRWLSVQVHPGDDYALAHEADLGKTEMWVVVEAAPDAELIYGFRQGTDRSKFAQAIREDRVDEFLHRLPVNRGDVIFVPSGAIHALGPGIMVAEIQQNSDTTYRIYDWGRDRPIHVEKALEVLDFELIEPQALTPRVLETDGIRREEIGRCRYFVTERYTISAGSSIAGNCAGETFEIWGVIEGTLTVAWQGGDSVTVSAVDWILLPADLGKYRIYGTGPATLLRITAPRDTVNG